jgi:hypothetical protein
MMTQLEKIAEAIELTPGPDGDSLSQLIGENWRIDEYTKTVDDVRHAVRKITLLAARAAIEAIRKPTLEMSKAGFHANSLENHNPCDRPTCIGRVTMPADVVWRAMVDVMLWEKP